MLNKYAYTLLLSFAFFFSATMANAQNDDAARLSSISATPPDSLEGWVTGGGLGFDLGNILVINPQPGSGQNRIGLGGATSVFARYKQDRFSWNNVGSLNFAIQKIGSGVLPFGEQIKIPYEKSLDDLRFNSSAAYQIEEGSKWAYAADFKLNTQLTPSYRGDDGKIYLKEIIVPDNLVTTLYSKIFAPAKFNLGVGMQYKPNDNFLLYYSPLTAELIYISDQGIANLGVHGTDLEDEDIPGIYQQSRLGLGSNLKAQYTRKALNERLTYASTLSFFSNYLKNPQNVDMEWSNEFAFEIYKGFNLSLATNLAYDDDIKSNVTDYDAPGGLRVDANGDPIARPTINYYHQLVLQYVRVF